MASYTTIGLQALGGVRESRRPFSMHAFAVHADVAEDLEGFIAAAWKWRSGPVRRLEGAELAAYEAQLKARDGRP